MKVKEMSAAELEARKAQIVSESEGKNVEELRALNTELDEINAELETRAAQAKAEAEERAKIARGAGKTTETGKDNHTMNNEEIRSSQAYLEAFAEGIKNGDFKEARALLTQNVEAGTVPVPTMVDEIVRKAWNKSGIMAKVKKLYLKGDLKIGFEISSSAAVNHTEGGDPISEETLVLGVVSINPISIKKYIDISDEVMDLRGAAFLEYIYSEIAYRIAEQAAANLITKINSAPTASTTTCVGIVCLTATQLSVGLVAKGLGELCDDAQNPVVAMNRKTWAALKDAQYANKYNVDPFEGLEVVFDSHIKAFDAATTGDTYLIVGDFGAGAVANLPNGEDITFKVDDKKNMEKDLVRIFGREYVGVDVVGPGCFTKIVK